MERSELLQRMMLRSLLVTLLLALSGCALVSPEEPPPAIVAIPDPAMVLDHEKGKAFVADLIVDQFLAKVANAAKPKEDGGTS